MIIISLLKSTVCISISSISTAYYSQKDAIVKILMKTSSFKTIMPRIMLKQYKCIALGSKWFLLTSQMSGIGVIYCAGLWLLSCINFDPFFVLITMFRIKNIKMWKSRDIALKLWLPLVINGLPFSWSYTIHHFSMV